jgi:Flp pilus assembly protein TadB
MEDGSNERADERQQPATTPPLSFNQRADNPRGNYYQTGGNKILDFLAGFFLTIGIYLLAYFVAITRLGLIMFLVAFLATIGLIVFYFRRGRSLIAIGIISFHGLIIALLLLVLGICAYNGFSL